MLKSETELNFRHISDVALSKDFAGALPTAISLATTVADVLPGRIQGEAG